MSSSRESDWLSDCLPALRAYVRRRAGRHLLGRESVSDLVQSACRELLEDLPEIDLEGARRVEAWLRMCAERKIVDRARRLRRQVDTISLQEALEDWQHGPADGLPAPERVAAAREELQRLHAALAALPEHYREVFELAVLEGASHAEIARRTGRTVGAVKNLVYRAKARVVMRLDGAFDP